MLLAAKTRLGTYEILGPLGAGGMGEVYRARDLRLGRDVAVKVLPSEVASNPNRLARFEREARTIAGLNHPNVVTLYSVEDEDGIRFLTMELVEGQTLSALVTPGGLPLSRVLEYSIPLAGALAAAHDRGIIHRDLKPGNVMVTREGRVKVLDFGLAKTGRRAANLDSETVTVTAGDLDSVSGQVMGTVPYMAPEQLRGESADPRADLFALGIILYELATGRRPFTGATSAEVISSILRDTPEPLTRIRGDFPGDLARIVSRCLEKNPRERAQSALDVCNELRRLKRGLEYGGRTASEQAGAVGMASIAVLPFVNRSHDESDEYFSDGLADELLNVLSKIPGLRVVARASSFQFKGKHEVPAVVGGKLNVSALLDGSVRKAGNRVRISVQLVRVSDGCHLWSETYDRTMEDIFAVQDDIAQSVVRELRTTLMGEIADSDSGSQAKAQVARAAKGRGTDPEALRLYLLARHLLDRYARQETVKAIEYLKDALARDPQFALAWAELGRAYTQQAGRSWAPVAEGFGRAREAVERALSLEPDLPEGHLRMGGIRMYHDWDWRGAEASYSRALELAPENDRVLRRVGMLALCMGRFEEAIEFCRRAMDLDPLSSGSYRALGGMFHVAGRFTEAENAYRMELELAPERVFIHGSLSETLTAQGRWEEALTEAMREPEEWVRLRLLVIIHDAMGQREQSDAALRKLIERYAESSAFQIAEVHAALGETDAAFQWVERAYVQRDGGLVGAKISPYFRSLHGDPRWSAFMRKMGFVRH